MEQDIGTLVEALAQMRAAIGPRRGRRYPGVEPAALRDALRAYVEAWEAWRGEAAEGWFLAKPLAERAVAHEAMATSKKARRILRALDPDSEVPMVTRSGD